MYFTMSAKKIWFALKWTLTHIARCRHLKYREHYRVGGQSVGVLWEDIFVSVVSSSDVRGHYRVSGQFLWCQRTLSCQWSVPLMLEDIIVSVVSSSDVRGHYHVGGQSVSPLSEDISVSVVSLTVRCHRTLLFRWSVCQSVVSRHYRVGGQSVSLLSQDIIVWVVSLLSCSGQYIPVSSPLSYWPRPGLIHWIGVR